MSHLAFQLFIGRHRGYLYGNNNSSPEYNYAFTYKRFLSSKHLSSFIYIDAHIFKLTPLIIKSSNQANFDIFSNSLIIQSNYLICLPYIILGFYIAFFISIFYFNKYLKNKNTYRMIILIIVLLPIAIIFTESVKYLALYFKDQKYFLESVMIIGTLTILANIIWNEYLLFKIEKRNILIEKIVTRDQIYKILETLKSDRTKFWFLSQLQEKRAISGEWPEANYLSASKNSELYLKLAQLDEKWLGLDR